jgi:uracil-DNA glycosylase
VAREEHPGAEDFVPSSPTLPRLRAAVQECRGCDLHRDATQAVFGDGTRKPRLVLVGEQPGDVEDRNGEPFVGPAGKLLDKALDAGKMRGQRLDAPDLACDWAVATTHPSAALRAENRDEVYDGIVADLRVAADALDD